MLGHVGPYVLASGLIKLHLSRSLLGESIVVRIVLSWTWILISCRLVLATHIGSAFGRLAKRVAIVDVKTRAWNIILSSFLPDIRSCRLIEALRNSGF